MFSINKLSTHNTVLLICIFGRYPLYNLESIRKICVGFLNHVPFQPNQRSSETHFQTTFSHFAKQEFPPPSPQTSPEPVNFPYFNNFLETNHAPYPSAPPVPIPYRRTRSAVFSAGQGSQCSENFRRALSGGGVRFGKLFGIAEAGNNRYSLMID